jgi:hypothetical protein
VAQQNTWLVQQMDAPSYVSKYDFSGTSIYTTQLTVTPVACCNRLHLGSLIHIKMSVCRAKTLTRSAALRHYLAVST